MGPHKKYEALIDVLKGYGRAAVAFSGGVDSTFLFYAARQALGHENVFAIHGVSELVSRTERNSVLTLLNELGVEQEMRIEVKLHPLNWPEFVINNAYRCYFCKKRMYQRFTAEGLKNDCTALLDGSNIDDLKKSRPGFRAIHELGVKTPLLEVELRKEEIRSLACKFRLLNHDKISNSCLATRFSEGIIIGKKGLELVEKCEKFLSDQGFSGLRVLPTPEINAVIQVTAEDMGRLATSLVRADIIDYFRSVGFGRVCVDLEARQ